LVAQQKIRAKVRGGVWRKRGTIRIICKKNIKIDTRLINPYVLTKFLCDALLQVPSQSWSLRRQVPKIQKAILLIPEQSAGDLHTVCQTGPRLLLQLGAYDQIGRNTGSDGRRDDDHNKSKPKLGGYPPGVKTSPDRHAGYLNPSLAFTDEYRRMETLVSCGFGDMKEATSL